MRYAISNNCITVTDDNGQQWKAPLMDGHCTEMTKYYPSEYVTEFTIRSKKLYGLDNALKVSGSGCPDNVSARLYFTLTNGEKAADLRVADKTFIMLDCIAQSAMDSDDDFDGTYEESELRRKLQGEYLDLFPQELRDRMVPWENGDLLRLPKAEEIFTDDELDEYGIPYDRFPVPSRWVAMEDTRNRIALWNGAPYWYWCENKYSASCFAVSSTFGHAGHSSASVVGGVRPVFRIS